MLDLHAVKNQDLKALSPAALADLASQMLAHIQAQSLHIDTLDKRAISQAQGIKWRDAKIESILFQLARLKAWRFGAKTERMNAEQRSLFEETFAADHASLQAQLEALRGATPDGAADADTASDKKPRKPKREPLPDHLPRVESLIEPEDTRCRTPECRQQLVRVGEDISERLDIVPAKFSGLAGRARPAGQPFARHKTSSGRLVSTLSSGRSAASGSASAASCCCRNRPCPKSSTTPCQRRACKPTSPSAASSTTFLITGKKRSTRAPVTLQAAQSRWAALREAQSVPRTL